MYNNASNTEEKRIKMQDNITQYAEKAVKYLDALIIQEEPGSGLPKCIYSEKLLQILWNEKRLSDEISSEEGKSIRIISPGTWNVSAGPDFRNAAVLIDGTLMKGDVEIHRRSSDWHAHGHDNDSMYNNVLLHVVWEDNTPDDRHGLCTLVFPKCLNSDWLDMMRDLEASCYPYARKISSGSCSLQLALSSNEHIKDILCSAGLSRFSEKSTSAMHLAADRGSDQSLYESIFDALGYKSNRSQFRALSQRIPLETLRNLRDRQTRMALLFGSAGMIPDMTMTPVLPQCKEQVLRLWDIWWSLGMQSDEAIEWCRSGIRPYNSPFRRLAAGIQILETTNYRPAEWLLSNAANAANPKVFLKSFNVLCEEIMPWKSLRDFSHEIKPAADLLGKGRLSDLLVNVFLPFLHGISKANGNSAIADLAKTAYMSLPPLQDNRLYKEAIQRFLIPPSRAVELVKSACHQQGMLDIYKNFCCALGNNCSLCPFLNIYDCNTLNGNG